MIVSTVKSTDVTFTFRLIGRTIAMALILDRLWVMWTDGSVVKFRFCGHWIDLQWGRLRYTQLMRTTKVETAIQWFRMSCAIFLPDFLVMANQFLIEFLYLKRKCTTGNIYGEDSEIGRNLFRIGASLSVPGALNPIFSMNILVLLVHIFPSLSFNIVI